MRILFLIFALVTGYGVNTGRKPSNPKFHKPRRYKIPRTHLKPVRENQRDLHEDDIHYPEHILQA